MGQLVLAILLTMLIVVFGMVNTHHVPLSPIFGEPIRVRMIFLLAIAFLAGSVVTFFYQMVSRLRRRAEQRRGARRNGYDRLGGEVDDL